MSSPITVTLFMFMLPPGRPPGRLASFAQGAEAIHLIKLNNVEPQAYIENVTARVVNGHLQSRLDELLPWAYEPKSISVAA